MTITQQEEERYRELQELALDYARNGETESLQKMLEHGLPINLSNEKGDSLLMLATYYGHLDTVNMLLNYQAEVDRFNLRGQTPLAGAIFKGYTEIVKVLLAAGANIYADSGTGVTPFLVAQMFKRMELLDLFQHLIKK